MINEVLEAECYLRGENIDKNNIYRMTNQIVRLLHERGKQPVEIRKEVFDWANKYGLFLEFSLNALIYQAQESKIKMRGDVDVYISEEDVENIARHVDQRVCKRVALAMLCYAKVAADRRGDFQMQSIQLGAWIGVNQSNLRGKYIKELLDFEYLTKVQEAHRNPQWRSINVKRTPSEWYRILEPVTNEGKWRLENNDIQALYDKIYK